MISSRRVVQVVGVLLAACLVPVFVPSGAAPEAALSNAAWHAALMRAPRPKKGCFHAAYPSLEWKAVPCKKAPNRPYNVGHGNDFSAKTSGLVTTAIGSFDAVNGVTGETGFGNIADSYSLQLNSSFFTTPACANAQVPANCQGWAQFIYSNEGSAFIEYWLIHWGNVPCPAGWTSVPPSCLLNSPAVAVPPQPIANLVHLSLVGSASAGGDSLSMSTGADVYLAAGDDTLNNLAQGWNYVEFNVFGDGGSSTAAFNPGSNIIVRTTVYDGTQNIPTCMGDGNTAETNNLDLVAPCCPYGGTDPAIVFDESNNPGATSMCANGTSIGDTHLTNFAGLLFDFQAAGDFLLAQTDAKFLVQTRQVSGAPTWPDATVNKAVAVRLGATRAAVCLGPNRLVVDGRPADLASGGTLTLAGGDSIARNGNTYTFARKSGESVRAELNASWINVTVGLGKPPMAKVRGLLGNMNGNTGEDDLAAKSGSVLARPVSFSDLYQRYGDSWRVPASESLLNPLCGKPAAEASRPSRPFFARDLTAKQRVPAEAICRGAGVRDAALLEACTLDVVVLGDKGAARAFVRTTPPRKVIQFGRH